MKMLVKIFWQALRSKSFRFNYKDLWAFLSKSPKVFSIEPFRLKYEMKFRIVYRWRSFEPSSHKLSGETLRMNEKNINKYFKPEILKTTFSRKEGTWPTSGGFRNVMNEGSKFTWGSTCVCRLVKSHLGCSQINVWSIKSSIKFPCQTHPSISDTWLNIELFLAYVTVINSKRSARFADWGKIKPFVNVGPTNARLLLMNENFPNFRCLESWHIEK